MKHGAIFIAGGAGAIVSIALALSLILKDPHIFQRGGATLLIMGAGLVFWQLRVEMRLERHLEVAQRPHVKTVMVGDDALAAEISKIRRLRLLEGDKGERVRVISWLVVVTALGEGIHGFGDLLVKWLLKFC